MSKEKSLAQQFKDLIQSTDQPETGIKDELTKLLPEAIDVMRDLLRSDSASIDQKFKASKMVIDLSDLSDRTHSARAPLDDFLDQLSTQEIIDLKRTADKILADWEKADTAENGANNR